MRFLATGLVFVLTLYPLQLAAQQQPVAPFEQALKDRLGDLSFANIALVTEVKRLTEENTGLKTKILELEKKLSEKDKSPK